MIKHLKSKNGSSFVIAYYSINVDNLKITLLITEGHKNNVIIWNVICKPPIGDLWKAPRKIIINLIQPKDILYL